MLYLGNDSIKLSSCYYPLQILFEFDDLMIETRKEKVIACIEFVDDKMREPYMLQTRKKRNRKEDWRFRSWYDSWGKREKEMKLCNVARQNGIRLVDKSDKRPWRALTGGPLLYAI
ncbi:hypothetical protein M0804_011733 [Polistes exclamans]|nr:hypothetical protein M0804_011733 [Polistes exclamans]